MVERLLSSVFLTACLWGIVNLSHVARVSPQVVGQALNSTDWVQIWVSRSEY